MLDFPLNFDVNASSVNSVANANANVASLIASQRSVSDSLIDFPVEIAPIEKFMPEFINNGEQVLYRPDTNKLLKVMGSRYGLLKNSDAFSAVDEVIESASDQGTLDISDMVYKDAVTYEGGRTIRQYFFPAHKVDIGGGDPVVMRLVVVNSYDGTSNFQTICGGFRIVCTNGIISGDNFVQLARRHTDNLDLNEVSIKLSHQLKSFHSTGEYWKQLRNTKLSNSQADRIVTQFATEGKKVSHRKFEMFDKLYRDHRDDLGANYWAMFNALTFWSTHNKVMDGNLPNLEARKLERENEVLKIVKSSLWEPRRIAA